MTLTLEDFTKPGPGTWTFDATHQSRPHPLLVQPIMHRGMDSGFRAAFRNVGALLDVIESRHVHGWLYQAVRPIGAPAESNGPPPRLIFKLVTKLHPELRRRIRGAEDVWTDKPWRAAVRRWREVEVGHRTELQRLQKLVGEDASSEELVSRLRECARLTERIMEDHFTAVVPASVPVGDLFVQAETRFDISVPRTARVLAGASTETSRPMAAMLEIVDALRDRGALDVLEGADEQAVLDTLCADPRVGRLMRDYLDEYAFRALEFHIDATQTLVERPDITVSTLRGLVSHAGRSGEDPGLEAAAEIRAELPVAAHDWWDESVADARAAIASRETSANMVAWGLGLLRLFALPLGEALHAEGRLPERRAIFAVTAEELAELPDVGELRRRLDLHDAAARLTPPRMIGTPGDAPPVEWLPPATARIERAVQAYVSRFDAAPDLPQGGGLCGLGVSSGTVSGQVFLLDDLDKLDEVPAGCILVTMSTNPTLNPVLPIIGGLVTELGGLICHAAIMSRELGFPGVVGCPNATTELTHGSWVQIDGGSGRVTVLDGPPAGHTVAVRDLPEPELIEPRVPAEPGRWVPLVDAGDVARYGGKAARLAAALRARHRVPPGVALDVDFVEAVAAGDEAHIARLAEAIDGLKGPFAVRSSAPAEDGSHASFAGMHHTELGVSPDAVAEAVAAVWHSGVAPAAQAYRARLGVRGRPQMAVLIQELVSADVSGVRFGRDPVTGEDVRIVECAPGLGALVVDGRVTPDRVRLDGDGNVIERTTGDTPIKLIPAASGGVCEVPVSAEEAAKNPIQNGLLRSVHELGEACDTLFEGAQDVEWAVVRDELWLLQSRPVTTGGAS